MKQQTSTANKINGSQFTAQLRLTSRTPRRQKEEMWRKDSRTVGPLYNILWNGSQTASDSGGGREHNTQPGSKGENHNRKRAAGSLSIRSKGKLRNCLVVHDAQYVASWGITSDCVCLCVAADYCRDRLQDHLGLKTTQKNNLETSDTLFFPFVFNSFRFLPFLSVESLAELSERLQIFGSGCPAQKQSFQAIAKGQRNFGCVSLVEHVWGITITLISGQGVASEFCQKIMVFYTQCTPQNYQCRRRLKVLQRCCYSSQDFFGREMYEINCSSDSEVSPLGPVRQVRESISWIGVDQSSKLREVT